MVSIKQLQLASSLAILSFFSVSKWWYALVEDAPTSVMKGFPFPYRCQGWHTSMSYQYFWGDLFLDFALYLFISFVVVKLAQGVVNRLNKIVLNTLNWLAMVVLVLNLVVIFQPVNLHFWNKHFKYQTKETKIQWLGRVIKRPEWKEGFVPYEWKD